MDNINIPKEALLAARQAFVNAGTADDDRDPFAEACLAMLRAWPGMENSSPEPWSLADRIILPLTETDDD